VRVSTLDAVFKQITTDGGRAQAKVIDALDDAAVNAYLDNVARQAETVDMPASTRTTGRHSTWLGDICGY
jgi:hypothetical protein